MYKNVNQSYMFQLGKLPNRWTKNIKKTTLRINGLSFEDEDGDLPQDQVVSILKNIHNTCVKEAKRPIIAFKGSNQIKKFMNLGRIPSLNLEHLLCPKYNELKNTFEEIYNCGRHTHSTNKVECPKQKVYVFKMWYLHKFC